MISSFTVPNLPKSKQWVVSLTTIPERQYNLLPITLASLKDGGFTDIHIYVDGDRRPWWSLERNYDITYRSPRIRTYGHWLLAALESYIRQPNSDLYLLVQDDLICYKNLRQYLERCKYPSDGYWNLYTCPEYSKLVTDNQTGWHLSSQLGKGALALVFDNQTMTQLLSARSMIEKPKHSIKGLNNVDGAVVTALKSYHVKEYFHFPSLVQHIGDVSSMGNSAGASDCFLGTDFNAMELIP